MLNMIATGNMRILKKLDGGKDVNGNSWAHFAAISCEETVEEVQKNDFYILKSFGTLADYIERNLNTPRRVLVSGELKLEKYFREIPIKREVKIEKDIYEIDFTSSIETQRTSIYVHSCTFLDKKRDKKEEQPQETVVITKASKDTKEKTKKETK